MNSSSATHHRKQVRRRQGPTAGLCNPEHHIPKGEGQSYSYRSQAAPAAAISYTAWTQHASAMHSRRCSGAGAAPPGLHTAVAGTALSALHTSHVHSAHLKHNQQQLLLCQQLHIADPADVASIQHCHVSSSQLCLQTRHPADQHSSSTRSSSSSSSNTAC
jgi:hypothetical protein